MPRQQIGMNDEALGCAHILIEHLDGALIRIVEPGRRLRESRASITQPIHGHNGVPHKTATAPNRECGQGCYEC